MRPLSRRRFARRVAACALLLASSWVAHAAPAVADEAAWVRAALVQHPAVAAARVDAAIAALAPSQLGGLPGPLFRASVSNIGIPPHGQPWLSIAAEQPIPLGGQRAAAAAALQAEVAVVAVAISVARAAVAADARALYAHARTLLRRGAVVQRHLAMAAQLRTALVRLAKVGRGATAAQLARFDADTAALHAERAAVAAEEGLLRLQADAVLGDVEAPPVELVDEPALALLPEEVTAGHGVIPDPAALAQHPTLRRLALVGAAQRLQVRAARAAGAPTVSPGVGLMSMPGMPIGVMVSVGLAFPTLPHTRQRVEDRVRAAALGVDAVTLRQHAEVRRLRAALASGLGELAALAARRRALVEGVLPARERAVAAAVAAVGAGAAGVVDVLAERHALLRLELEIVAVEGAWLQARAALLRRWAGADGGVGGIGMVGGAGAMVGGDDAAAMSGGH